MRNWGETQFEDRTQFEDDDRGAVGKAWPRKVHWSWVELNFAYIETEDLIGGFLSDHRRASAWTLEAYLEILGAYLNKKNCPGKS